MFPRKALLWLAVFHLVLQISSPAAEAPANDLVENARVLAPTVASVTNVTNFGSTVSMGDPETNSVFGNIWFRHAPISISSTGRVSLTGGSPGSRSLRVYEMTEAGWVRRAMNASSVMVTNTPGKTNFIGVYFFTAQSNVYALNYSFATLQLARPAHGGSFTADAPIEIEAQNPELDVPVTGLTVRTRNGELGWVDALAGEGFPFAGQWTPSVAGYVDFFVEATTASGELRRSGTNQVTVRAANDQFANAVALAPGGGDLLFRPFLLTREAGEPTVSMAPSMWFRWVPERSGVARVAAGPTQQLVLYRGETLGSLTQVASLAAVAGMDGLQAEVTAGQIYYVAAYASDANARRLTYSVAPMRFASPTVRTGLKAPLAIDLALSGVPADVEAVDYFRNGVLIGTSTAPPFALRWENVLTGPMAITAVGRGAGGARYDSEVIGLQVSAVNDNFADATVLPPDRARMDIFASANHATHGEFETGPGIWYRWTPASGGFCAIVPVEQGIGILVLSQGTRVAEGYNQRVSFQSQAGRTYSILITHSIAPENGFHVSIYNSPISLTDATGLQGYGMELRPTITGATTGIARVDYVVGEEIVASGVGPGFVGIWVPPLIGSHFVRAQVIYDDGVVVDAGWATIRVAPANDMFALATVLAGDVTQHQLSVDSTWATTETGEPGTAVKTVWWKWTPAFAGRVKIKIDSDGFQHSAMVGTGATLSGLSVVARDYSIVEGLFFNAVPGTTYHIGIGGNFNPLMWTLTQETLAVRLMSAATSPIRLGVVNTNPNDVFTSVDFYANGELAGTAAGPNFEFVWAGLGTTIFEVRGRNQLGQVRRSLPLEVRIAASNDHFADATPIPSSATNVTVRGSLANATVEEGEGWAMGEASVWWRWTPMFSGRVTFRSDSQSAFDGQVAIGGSVASLTEVARISAWTPVADFRAEAGVTYHISMRGAPNAGAVEFVLEQETFELFVPMRRLPIDLVVSNSNAAEIFEAAAILDGATPIATVMGPEWRFTWTDAAPGRHLLSAVSTNSLGEVRATRVMEYWVGPENDYFADAAELDLDGVTSGTLGNSSMEPGEVKWYAEEQGTVWYRFTARRRGFHTFIFETGGANIAGRTAFFQGIELRSLQALGRNFAPNSVIAHLEAGVSYFMVVSTTDRRDEPFAFRVVPPPVNDFLDDAIELTGNTPSFSGDTTSASRELPENEMVRNQFDYGSIWFRWTPTVTGNATFYRDASPGALFLMVVSGSTWGDARLHYPYTSLVEWANGLPMRVVAGTTYHFALYAPPGQVSGHITIQPINAPANDFRRDAALLTGSSVRVTGELLNSTLEVGETGPPGGYDASIWYRWVAPSVGRLRYWLDGGVGLWERGQHVRATFDNDDAVGVTQVDAGEVVYFQVSCPWNDMRPATLNLEFEPGTPVVNDAFADAMPITQFPFGFEGDILWATREAGEPGGAYPDSGPHTAWYSFRATEVGAVSASVESIGIYWNVGLVVYRGTSLGALEYLGETMSGTFSFLAEPGQEYRLQIQNSLNGGFPGRYAIAVRFDAKPGNDMFADRSHLSANRHEVGSWIISPTTEPGEPLVAPQLGGTLWWTWTAPADGRLGILPWQIRRPNSANMAKLAVYTGASLDQLVLASTNAPFLFNVRQGTIFQIQAYPDHNNVFEQTGFTLEFYPFLPATNDDFADAALFDGTPKSNLGATREVGEPQHASGGPNKSLWWKFSTGENRVVQVRPEFSTMGPVTIAVYQGGSVDTLRLVHKGIDNVFFDVWAGETYYVAVETPAAVTGDIRMELFHGDRTTATRPVPGNLVQNGSFEDFFSPVWASYQFGGAVNSIAPDGRNYGTTWIGWIRQNIATRAGERYLIRFVFAPEVADQDAFVVLFAGVEIGRARASATAWTPAEFIGTASGSNTTLEIQGTGPAGPGGSIDHISVVTLSQPPAVVSEPVAANVFEGSPILFHTGLTGADPMARQWYRNDQPIAGETDVTLRFGAARMDDAGIYHMVATNPYGRAETARVRLTVEPATPLQIVLQPQSEAAYAGQYLALQSAAVGAPPIQHQWFRNGIALDGQTNSALVFASFAAEEQGTYTVRVSNAAENVTSLPAVVSVAPGAPSGGGLVFFSNSWGEFFNPTSVPVFDVGGETHLHGTNYVAQLYAGPSAEMLRPVGPPCRFGLRNSGTWLGRTIALPNIPPNAPAFVQVRVWDESAASSYEAARALGARFGRSEVMTITTTAPMFPPQIHAGAVLDGLRSFSLMAGLPNFVTGNLMLEERQAGGVLVWRLTGAAGFRYLIERQTDGASWLPFTVLQNASGSVTFTDTADSSAHIQIYRARMLD